MSPIGASKKNLPKTQLGFTLLELMLVVLIAAVLAGMSVPMFRKTFNNLQFERCCWDLAALLNYAGQRAIFSRTEYRFRLNTDEAKFWIEYNGLPVGNIYYLPRGISIIADKKELIFYPNGSADKATITVTSGARSRIFTTEGTRGHVKIVR